MSLTIRPATADDLDRIVLFNRALARETEGRDLDRSVLRPGVAALLEDPSKGVYYLAERAPEDDSASGDAAEGDPGGDDPEADDGRVVAQLMVTTEWSDWRNAEIWWIQSVYVSREHRRAGIYRALHEDVRRRAREAGAAGLRLYVDRDNAPAHATYEELGMRRSDYRMYEEMWR